MQPLILSSLIQVTTAVCLFIQYSAHVPVETHHTNEDDRYTDDDATGLTKEADCAWCAPGKYQTGVGLIAEANCTSCVAGKYQSGSGLSAASFWLL